VAQVDRFTPANVEIGDIFKLTVTGTDGRQHTISFTATATTVANVTAGLVAAWNAATSTLCTSITAADVTTHLTLTADAAGTGFSVASSTVDGGGNNTQTLARTATTANSGPYDLNKTANWDTGALPSAGDDVWIEGAIVKYTLDWSGLGTLASLNITRSQVGDNPADGWGPVYMQVRATVVNIGYHHGAGTPAQSSPINLDLGNVASTVNVFNTGSNGNAPAVRIKADSATTNVLVRKGAVGIAYEAGQTTTIGTLTVSYVSAKATDADVYVGAGVTMTTLNQLAGDVIMRCGATTATCEYGTLKTEGSGTFTALNVSGGVVTSNSSGTITAANVIKGTLDLTKSSQARTITTPKMGAGGTIKFDPAVMTFTNKIAAYESGGLLQWTGAAA
jgi:hypothetical protein